MSRLEKEIRKLENKPKDFTYDQLKKILNNLDFIENNKGKTSGSRVVFENIKIDKKIELHKPHPSNVLKAYQVNEVLKSLKEWGIL